LTFLINSGIVEVPKVEQLESKIDQLEDENDRLRKELAEAHDKPESNFSKPLAQKCDPSYPDVCIEEYPPDLDCGKIKYANFRVLPPDPHGFDRDNDGIGCES
jgi:micrococcal nuclease